MYWKLLAAFVVLLQCNLSSGQRQWVMPNATAAEMRNPNTWYWPYSIAAAEAYREYVQNCQIITHQLYQQAHATQAFPWANNPSGQGSRGKGKYVKGQGWVWWKGPRGWRAKNRTALYRPS